jgi:hypothetical protein
MKIVITVGEVKIELETDQPVAVDESTSTIAPGCQGEQCDSETPGLPDHDNESLVGVPDEHPAWGLRMKRC